MTGLCRQTPTIHSGSSTIPACTAGFLAPSPQAFRTSHGARSTCTPVVAVCSWTRSFFLHKFSSMKQWELHQRLLTVLEDRCRCPARRQGYCLAITVGPQPPARSQSTLLQHGRQHRHHHTTSGHQQCHEKLILKELRLANDDKVSTETTLFAAGSFSCSTMCCSASVCFGGAGSG